MRSYLRFRREPLDMPPAQTLSRLVLAAFLLASAWAARAEEPARKRWKDAAELSLTNTTGNSRLTMFGANDLFNYDWGRTALELKAEAFTSRDHGRTRAEEYDASEKVARKLTGKFYGYERFEWDKNRFDGILDRYKFFLGAGDELLSAEKDKLIGEGGVGFVSEERPDKTNNLVSGRLYGKYTRALSKTASFSQGVVYLHDFKDATDYHLNTETALVASVASHVSIKASYKWKRAGRPVPGFGKDDTVTGMALVIDY